MPNTTVIIVFLATLVPVFAFYTPWIKGMRLPNWVAMVLVFAAVFAPPVPLAVLLVAWLFRQPWAQQRPLGLVLICALILVTALWIGGLSAVDSWIRKGREQKSL